MTHLTLLWKILIICTISSIRTVGTAFGINFQSLSDELRTLIAERTTSDAALLEAISHLGRHIEKPEFWTTIANDREYSISHRRRCVFALFRRHARFDTLELSTILKGATWFNDNHISKFDRLLGLPAPVGAYDINDTVFEIQILPVAKLPTESVFIVVSAQITVEQFIQLLRSGGEKQTIRGQVEHRVISNYGFTDDYDKWLNSRND